MQRKKGEKDDEMEREKKGKNSGGGDKEKQADIWIKNKLTDRGKMNE